MRSALLLLLTLVICPVAPELAIGQDRYEFLLLGGFGKDLDSTPNAINELGQVTGGAMTASFESHAFRTKPNAPIDRKTDDLGSDGFISTGLDINDLGQVVGHTWQPGSE